VFVVAIAELTSSVDDEAGQLAADLGATVYDARLLLAAGTPSVVRTTADKAQALDLLGRLRARGHGAVACDTDAVVASTAMISMRRFRLETDAVTLDEQSGERLRYDDILAMVAAVHRRRTDVETRAKETRFSVARAAITGGMSMRKTVTTQSRSASEERDAVLYVFRKDAATPWILRESGTVWAGHGRPLAPSAGDNFRMTVAALRERAPNAAYDDRLVSRKAIAERTAVAGGGAKTTVKSSSEGAVDLLAHLLALWLGRASSSAAYR